MARYIKVSLCQKIAGQLENSYVKCAQILVQFFYCAKTYFQCEDSNHLIEPYCLDSLQIQALVFQQALKTKYLF